MAIDKKKSGYCLTKALTHIANARTRLAVLSGEKYVHQESKKMIRTMVAGLDNTLMQFKRMLGDDYRKLFEESVLEDDVALQVEEITDNLLRLPPGIRNQAEAYVASLARVYGDKIPE